MPLYLSNTNRLESLQGGVLRGPYSASVQPVTPGNYFNGLGLYQYFTAPDILSSSAQIPALTQSGSAFADSGSLQPTFVTNGVTQRSAQWLGYFKPSTTETYTFFAEEDDACWWWVGSAATASAPTTASAVLGYQGAAIGGNKLTGSISLTSGSYYPVRIQYTAVAFPDFFTASFSTPTITKTTDFTGYTYCNTASLGF
jgi:hypothetical protein